MPSKLKMTSGGSRLGDLGGAPNKTTESPDRTLLTRALPVAGRMIGGVAVGEAVAMIAADADVGITTTVRSDFMMPATRC